MIDPNELAPRIDVSRGHGKLVYDKKLRTIRLETDVLQERIRELEADNANLRSKLQEVRESPTKVIGGNMTATDLNHIKYRFKRLYQFADELTQREFRLVLQFEEQFKRSNFLSEEQDAILEQIYLRRT